MADDVRSNAREETGLQPLHILIITIVGVVAGLFFRSAVLPALTASLVAAIGIANCLLEAEGGVSFLDLAAGVIALQGGYIVGLWLEQYWRSGR